MLRLSVSICFHVILLHKHLKTINVAHLWDLNVHLSFPLLCSVVKTGQEWRQRKKRHTTWHDSAKSDYCSNSFFVWMHLFSQSWILNLLKSMELWVLALLLGRLIAQNNKYIIIIHSLGQYLKYEPQIWIWSSLYYSYRWIIFIQWNHTRLVSAGRKRLGRTAEQRPVLACWISLYSWVL